MSLFITLVGFLTFAQANGAAASGAEKLVREGIALRRSGNDEAALARFQKAHEMSPSPRTFVQLGLCEQALGLWAEADVHLSEALKATDDDWIKTNKATIQNSLRLVKANTGRVEIIGSPEGADVLVNGKSVGKVPLSGPIRVSKGPVAIELKAPGFTSALRKEAVEGNQYLRVVVRLDREPVPEPPRIVHGGEGGGVVQPPLPPPAEAAPVPAWRPAAKWVAWGGAAVGLGVGILGSSKAKTARDGGATTCFEGDAFDVDACTKHENDYNSGKTMAMVGYVGAAALAAGGLVLYLTEPKGASAEAKTEGDDAGKPQVSFGAVLLPSFAAVSGTLRF